MAKTEKVKKVKPVKEKKAKDNRSFRSFVSATLLQAKDKMKFSLRKPDGKVDVKTLIQKIVFFAIKFIVIAVAVAGLIYISDLLSLFTKTEYINLFTVFYFVFIVLTLISNTVKLMKDLYYSDDNKFLVTLPVSSSGLFFSKLIVFFVFDFIKMFEVLIPVTFGFGIIQVIIGEIAVPTVLWCFVPLVIANLVFALIAAFLSIPALFIYRLIKSYPILELVGAAILVVGGVIGVIFLIQLIPENINLVQQWNAIRNSIQNFLNDNIKFIYPFAFVTKLMFGRRMGGLNFVLTWKEFVFTLIPIGIILVLSLLVYLIIKPIYFNMMTKSFEFDKNMVGAPKRNIKHKKYITFTNKEFKLTFRDVEISGSYLIVYIAAPILLLFMDKVFMAINTRLEGDQMTYAFNILLIILPYLASNSLIATMFSKEGRAAYIKKTKPINVFLPLTSKLIFNLLLSVPSIIGCAVVFGIFAKIGWFPPVAIAISVILIQYGHILFSAMRDIMNPQNEVYATNGEDVSNPNERTSTIVGFVIAFAIALLMYLFLKESMANTESYTGAFIRMIIMSIAIFGSCLTLYILYIKAYYYDK